MQDDNHLYSLIARCALRDQKALNELYQAVAPYLNKVAFNLLKSEDLSNDVLQEAFIQIWQNADQYRQDKAKPLTWMTSIVRYRALDRLAKEKRHSDQIETTIDEADQANAVVADERPDHEVMRSQDMAVLLACMETLNDRTKESIKLAYLHGYSRDEIAAKFKSSTNTIKSWLKRGADRLKQCIETKVSVQQ